MPESAAREVILSRVRRANASVDASSRAAEQAAIPRHYDQTSTSDRETVLALFAERLREYDAVVHESAAGEIAEAIRSVLTANGQRSFIASQDFPSAWLPPGIPAAFEAASDTHAMDRAQGALAACEVAIAHTGTIVLQGSRRLTLLPDRLLCVIRKDQVVETVPEAFARLQSLAAAPLTFISGPSATADIEMTRIRGVHGPRFLDVILVRG